MPPVTPFQTVGPYLILGLRVSAVLEEAAFVDDVEEIEVVGEEGVEAFGDEGRVLIVAKEFGVGQAQVDQVAAVLGGGVGLDQIDGLGFFQYEDA